MTLSWKWPSTTFSPFFGLYRSEKALFRGVPSESQQVSSVRICPRASRRWWYNFFCWGPHTGKSPSNFVTSFVQALSEIGVETYLLNGLMNFRSVNWFELIPSDSIPLDRHPQGRVLKIFENHFFTLFRPFLFRKSAFFGVFGFSCIFMRNPSKHWFWHPCNISFSKI